MSTDPQGGANKLNSAGRAEVSQRRLWFGFATAAIAWSAAGSLDVMVVWAVAHQETFGIPPAHPFARIIEGLLGLALLILTICAGTVSYRSWKKLSARREFLDAEGVERHEFMAVLGVIMTLTLGMGIFWFALPPILLDFCWRAR
ncbi:MAG: hypothetical protein ACRD3N_09120 [Terracidiphilus sp.]